MYRVFLGLGSNVGNREEYLNRAAVAISRLPETRVVWFSSVYETEPYGNAEQSKFLNAAAEIETALYPPQLLAALKQIETETGRKSSEHWGPREIDIDILLYDALVFSDASVTVPHADLEHRRFVLVPLREIAPDLVHPVTGLTVEEMAAACTGGRVVNTSFHIRF